MNVRSGACNVISCKFLAFLGHAQSTKPICSPIRTFNSMVLVFLIHFHCERGGDFQRVSASNNRWQLRKAIFNAVTNRISDLSLTFFEYAVYCKRQHCYFSTPTPKEITEFEQFLLSINRSFRSIQSRQFDVAGFSPFIDWQDIQQYTQSLRQFKKLYLDELVGIFLGGGIAEGFFERLINTVFVSASHSRRGVRGWKNHRFAASLMMLDLVSW